MSAPRTRTWTPEVVREFSYPAETRQRWHEEERAVLGAVLLDESGGALHSARARLPTAECFDDASNASVWGAMLALADQHVPIGVETLAHELRVREVLNAVGGPQFIGELTDTLPSVALVDAHAQLVAEAHATRATVREALGIVERGTVGDFKEVYKGARRAMETATARDPHASLAPLSELIEAQFAVIEAVHKDPSKRAAPGLPWHLPTLQEWTDGLHAGELCVIAARPGSGKSAFLEQLCVHMAKNRPDAGAVVYWSLEMVHREWIERCLACEASVDLDFVRARKAPNREQLQALFVAANALHGLKVFVDDASRQSPSSIRASAERVKRHHGLAAIVVDYLQLTEANAPTTRRGADTRAEEVAQMTRAFKVMAKDLGIPVILAAQLNRESEKGGKSARPRLANLRESGAVEQDANLVILLHVEGDSHGETAESHYKDITVIVEKSRNSRTGDVRTYFTGPFQRFTERAKEPAPEADAVVTQGRPGRTAAAPRGGGYTAEPDEAPGVPFGELQ
jgi:replicative DNA helicase